MKLFDVYPLFNVNIVKGKGCHVWDDKGNEYLDLYGGHAVISIGHSHPHYIEQVGNQLEKLGFYSNSVINSLQKKRQTIYLHFINDIFAPHKQYLCTLQILYLLCAKISVIFVTPYT